MTNQKKIEILEKVVQFFYQEKHSKYICNNIRIASNWKEEANMVKWFTTKKPSKLKYVDFYNHDSYIKTLNPPTSSWWDREEKFERIRFLETLINELKEEIA